MSLVHLQQRASAQKNPSNWKKTSFFTKMADFLFGLSGGFSQELSISLIFPSPVVSMADTVVIVGKLLEIEFGMLRITWYIDTPTPQCQVLEAGLGS